MRDRNIGEGLLKRAAVAAAREIRHDALTRLAKWVDFLEHSPNSVLFPMGAEDVRELVEAFRDGREHEIVDKARGVYRKPEPTEPEKGLCPCGCGFKAVMCAKCKDENPFTRGRGTGGKAYPLPEGCPDHPEETRHAVEAKA